MMDIYLPSKEPFFDRLRCANAYTTPGNDLYPQKQLI